MLKPNKAYSKRIIEAIKSDGSWNDDDDWNMTYMDDHFEMVEVNVCDNNYVEMEDDEVAISACNFEQPSSVVFFIVKKEALYA